MCSVYLMRRQKLGTEEALGELGNLFQLSALSGNTFEEEIAWLLFEDRHLKSDCRRHLETAYSRRIAITPVRLIPEVLDRKIAFWPMRQVFHLGELQ